VVGVEVRSGLLPMPDGCVTVGRVAALLTHGGETGLSAALDLLVADLGLRSAVLREVTDTRPGGVLAIAGDVMHAVPLAPRPRAGRADSTAVELPVSGADRLVATLTVVGARPSQLPALRACAAVLALRLHAHPVPAPEVFAAADAEVDALADALHDGPVQDLVVARYAADAALGAADQAAARDAVQAALVALRRALWLLRPRGGTEGRLADALSALSDQLCSSGAAPLLLELDERAVAALTSAEAAAAYRLVQAVATEHAGGESVRVALHRDGDELRLEVDGGHVVPSPSWTARARALGARLTSTPGRLLLAFPSRLEVAP
jgi:hypothetical protein